MSTHRDFGSVRVVAEARRTPILPNGVMGMILFVATEAMVFAGMISAFLIVKSGAMVWPPPGQPRLPIEQTALNTVALLASGAMLLVAHRRFQQSREEARKPLLWAMALGAFFVVFQGYEWLALISQGLTLTSSNLGSFFYLIVGVHAIHAVAGFVLLFQTYRRLERGWLAQSQLATAEVFWYFVVGLWPVLYWVVYL